MPSKVISKTVTSCISKDTCLGVCLKSCKILKYSCPLKRLPSDTLERFVSCQNNQNGSSVASFTSGEVQNNKGNGNEIELASDTVVLQKSTSQVDFHQLDHTMDIMLDTPESYLVTDDHTSTNYDDIYGFNVARNNAGTDQRRNKLAEYNKCRYIHQADILSDFPARDYSHMDVQHFRCSGDHNKRNDSADFCDVLPIDGQCRNNDRSDINIYSNNVAVQDALLKGDEGALILSLHEEKQDIMSLSYTDFRDEVLTNSDDPWLGLNLQFEVNRQDYEFKPFFLDSECTAALDSDFFNDLPSLLDSECPSWLLSSPKDISSDKPVTLVLDLDETLVHTSPSPCEGTDFIFQLDERILYVQKRPFLHSFLERVSELFRIIIFTAGTRKYADQVLDILDPGRRLTSRRAYRDSCIFSNNGYKKDLTVLGVDLAKLAIVDNTPAVFHELQLNNGIPIKSWIGDPTDRELQSLLPFLETLACADDVRPFISEKFGSIESP